MKRIILALISSIVFILWCSFYNTYSYRTSLFILENDLFDLRNQSNIVFVWPNSTNGAWYYITISCRNGIPYGFEYLPEDKAVEIIFREDCIKNKIPVETLDALTKKKFSYVYWDMYFQGRENIVYPLSVIESEKIAKAPWSYIAISGFNKDIGRILRDTKNPIRKWYEPTGNPEIYTTEDKEKCDWLWWNGLNEWHEEEWRIQSEKVLECYRNLPPLP